MSTRARRPSARTRRIVAALGTLFAVVSASRPSIAQSAARSLPGESPLGPPGPTLVHDGEPWQEPDPIPMGYTPKLKARREAVRAGILLLTIPYGLGATGALADELVQRAKHENSLLLPAVGPLVQMVETTNPAGNVALSLDALLQLSGVALIAYGIASPTTVLVHETTALTFALTPLVGAGRSGLLLVGVF